VRFAQAIVAEKGTDAWFYMSTEDLLPEKYRSMAESLRKGTDTMDVWFDSGSSWASVVNQREGLRLPVRVDATPPLAMRPFATSRTIRVSNSRRLSN
jgi:isoleucyl-tRNA synthetase